MMYQKHHAVHFDKESVSLEVREIICRKRTMI